jgi:hypothetical protein
MYPVTGRGPFSVAASGAAPDAEAPRASSDAVSGPVAFGASHAARPAATIAVKPATAIQFLVSSVGAPVSA